MLNGKNTVIRLMVGLVKKAWYICVNQIRSERM